MGQRVEKRTGPLHTMNPARVDFIRTRAAAHLKRGDEGILDQIRGQMSWTLDAVGLLAESLSRLGANVFAIDPAEENIRIARLHSKGEISTRSISYEHKTIEEMAESGRL